VPNSWPEYSHSAKWWKSHIQYSTNHLHQIDVSCIRCIIMNCINERSIGLESDLDHHNYLTLTKVCKLFGSIVKLSNLRVMTWSSGTTIVQTDDDLQTIDVMIRPAPCVIVQPHWQSGSNEYTGVVWYIVARNTTRHFSFTIIMKCSDNWKNTAAQTRTEK